MTTTPQDLLRYTDTNTMVNSNAIGNVFHSGDMVYVDTIAQGTSTYNILALDTDTHAAAFAGIVMGTYDPTNYGIYNNDPVETNGYAIQRTGVWAPYGTSGQTYFPGTAVYIGSDAQTVTLKQAGTGTSGYTNVVGYVYGLPGSPGFATGGNASTTSGVAATGMLATGTKTTQILCWINKQYPATSV